MIQQGSSFVFRLLQFGRPGLFPQSKLPKIHIATTTVHPSLLQLHQLGARFGPAAHVADPHYGETSPVYNISYLTNMPCCYNPNSRLSKELTGFF